MVDIDHFKALNDTHGHQVGDEVLRNVAAALACECREFDLAARYGGEEVALILPGCTSEECIVIAERFRRVVPPVVGGEAMGGCPSAVPNSGCFRCTTSPAAAPAAPPATRKSSAVVQR